MHDDIPNWSKVHDHYDAYWTCAQVGPVEWYYCRVIAWWGTVLTDRRFAPCKNFTPWFWLWPTADSKRKAFRRAYFKARDWCDKKNDQLLMKIKEK